MDTITNMVKGKMTEVMIGQMASKFGLSSGIVDKLVQFGLPMIMSGIGKNAASKDGAAALASALDEDHDGSILDKFQDLIGDQSTVTEGHKILGHVFGDKLGDVTQNISKAAGTDSNVVDDLLSNLAPMVMGQLGAAKKEQGLDVSALTEMLGVEKEAADSNLGGFQKMLDRDNDGSIMDDMMNIAKKFF